MGQRRVINRHLADTFWTAAGRSPRRFLLQSLDVRFGIRHAGSVETPARRPHIRYADYTLLEVQDLLREAKLPSSRTTIKTWTKDGVLPGPSRSKWAQGRGLRYPARATNRAIARIKDAQARGLDYSTLKKKADHESVDAKV